MSGLLDGKVVLINGGTQGVGGVARAAVREGAQVVVTGRRLDAGKRFAAELETGGDVRFVQTDMADPQQARRSVTRTVEEFGRIDGLCNAAGITTRGTLLDTTPELFDTHIAVNLRGPFFAMQAAVADMVERGPRAASSTSSRSPRTAGREYLAPYVAAKAGGRPTATPPTRIGGTASASTASTSAGPKAKAKHRPSDSSTRPTTTGPPRPPRSCRWANSASPMRSPRSSCCCSRRAAGWSLDRSSTGTRL